MKYNVVVIGGGPSGLMAAIAAAEQGAATLLIDKGSKLGRKLAISGGGRCNVTNRLPVDEIIRHIPGNGKFLYGAFSEFDNEGIISFFKDLGVELKEEDHGRMFPVNDKAQSVVDAMVRRLHELGAHVRTDTPISDVLYEDGQVKGILTKQGELIDTDSVVIAVGGKSVPHTGSTGDGYAWAEKAGHTITDLFPTEVPLTSKEPFIQQKELQGLSLRDVSISVLNPKGKALITHRMDMIFTHFGLSGPGVLRCSQFVVKAQKKWKLKEVTVQIDALPDMNGEQLFQQVIATIKTDDKKAVKNSLKGLLPERYLLFLLERNQIDPSAQGATIAHDKWRSFCQDIKKFPVAVNGTLSLDKAFVTGGGVSVKEVEPKTMASKFMSGLFFCGEILDIHGYTGGYNITSALVTGRLAGINAALNAGTSL
ncbi:NAD(P)/FAD-dependent oxidoreductase [Pradoshia sp.]